MFKIVELLAFRMAFRTERPIMCIAKTMAANDLVIQGARVCMASI